MNEVSTSPKTTFPAAPGPRGPGPGLRPLPSPLPLPLADARECDAWCFAWRNPSTPYLSDLLNSYHPPHSGFPAGRGGRGRGSGRWARSLRPKWPEPRAERCPIAGDPEWLMLRGGGPGGPDATRLYLESSGSDDFSDASLSPVAVHSPRVGSPLPASPRPSQVLLCPTPTPTALIGPVSFFISHPRMPMGPGKETGDPGLGR